MTKISLIVILLTADSRAQWLQASETWIQGLTLKLNPEEMKGKMPKVVISSVHNLYLWGPDMSHPSIIKKLDSI